MVNRLWITYISIICLNNSEGRSRVEVKRIKEVVV